MYLVLGIKQKTERIHPQKQVQCSCCIFDDLHIRVA